MAEAVRIEQTFDRLHEFARELAHHLHRQRLEAVSPKGTILGEDSEVFRRVVTDWEQDQYVDML